MILPDNRFTAVLDANVLYPFLKKDILLRFFEAGFFKARWTQEITDEWVRHRIANKPHHEAKVHRTAQLMEAAFPDALVTGYESILAAVSLPDPDDRHVLAAAIRCGADYIVTQNLRDFPNDVLATYDIEVGTADAFLCATFELFEQDALADLRDHRMRLKAKPTPSEYIMTLRRGELPQLASRVQEYLNLI